MAVSFPCAGSEILLHPLAQFADAANRGDAVPLGEALPAEGERTHELARLVQFLLPAFERLYHGNLLF